MKLFNKSIKAVSSKKGYTLLFAVIVSVLLLSIAAFILSVSRKQAILSSAARDSIYAFYAADSGLECAVENLSVLANASGTNPMHCGGSSITVNWSPSGGNISAVGTSTFSMPAGGGTTFTGTGNQTTQSGAASCASTSVAYVYTPGTDSTATTTVVTVTVRGYNIGYENNSGVIDCNVSGPRKVERLLQYTAYQ